MWTDFATQPHSRNNYNSTDITYSFSKCIAFIEHSYSAQKSISRKGYLNTYTSLPAGNLWHFSLDLLRWFTHVGTQQFGARILFRAYFSTRTSLPYVRFRPLPVAVAAVLQTFACVHKQELLASSVDSHESKKKRCKVIIWRARWQRVLWDVCMHVCVYVWERQVGENSQVTIFFTRACEWTFTCICGQ